MYCCILLLALVGSVSASDDRREKGLIAALLEKGKTEGNPKLLVFPGIPLVLEMETLLEEIAEKALRDTICRRNLPEEKPTITTLDGYDPKLPCQVFCKELLGGNLFYPQLRFFRVLLKDGTACDNKKICSKGDCIPAPVSRGSETPSSGSKPPSRLLAAFTADRPKPAGNTGLIDKSQANDYGLHLLLEDKDFLVDERDRD